tara:strand:+ start:63 stop:446 length:384 start_codon:yes stop_codon:yes gene_type:complete
MKDKVFKFRGKTLEELTKMTNEEFALLLNSRKRRSLLRLNRHDSKKILEKVDSGKSKLRTHSRTTVITPKLVGKTIEVYNGQKFIPVKITEEMLGYYLGEFSQTRRIASHKGIGVGATKSSKNQGKK